MSNTSETQILNSRPLTAVSSDVEKQINYF